MSTYDWLLFIHVLGAFALVAALVVFNVLMIAGRNVDRPSAALPLFRLAVPANVLVIAGSLITLALGIWLAIDHDAYELSDGWIIAAIVLWAIAVETGRRGGAGYARAQKLASQLADAGNDAPSAELRAHLRERRDLVLNVVSEVSVLAILMLMIFKPGAP